MPLLSGIKQISLLCLLLFCSMNLRGNKFYKPASYRYYLYAMDRFWSCYNARPMAPVLMKGERGPVIPDFKQIFPGKNLNRDGSCSVVIRDGIAGKCVAAETSLVRESRSLPYLKPGFYHIVFRYAAPDGGNSMLRETTLDIIEENNPPAMRTPERSAGTFYAEFDGQRLLFHNTGKYDRIHLKGETVYNSHDFSRIHPAENGTALLLNELKPGLFMRIHSRLEQNGTIVAEAVNYVGKPGVYPPRKPDYSKVGKPAPLSGFLIHENESFVGRFEDNEKGLAALLDEMKKRGSNVLMFDFVWNYYNPLTGVFNFEQLDRYVDFLTRNRIHFDISIGCAFFEKAPWDSKGEWMMNHKGNCLLHRNNRTVSTASPKYKTAVRNVIRALWNRYGENPYWRGWVYKGQGLDGGIFRDTWSEVTDYAPAFRTEFREFLRKRYSTIAALNRKWKTDFPSFEAVTPPLPDYSKQVETSPEWMDFTDAKMHVLKEVSVHLFEDEIRKYDKQRAITSYLMYQGPIEYLFPDLHAKNSAVQDGGGESEYMVRLYSICENNGIHRQAESVYVPADRILMQQDLVTNTLRYGMHLSDLGTVWNGYLNLHSAEFAGTNRWNGGAVIPFKTYPERNNLKQTMAFWTEIIKVLRTMKETKPLPPPVGFVLSWDDLFYRSRCWRWFGLLGGNLTEAGACLSLGNVPWVTGITAYEIWKKNKLLICSDENKVFSREMIRKMERFAKEGGILAIAGDVGEYTVAQPEKYLWKTVLRAPDRLDAAPFTEWLLGKGRIIYARLEGKEAISPECMEEILRRAGIMRMVVSSNPQIEAFLLEDGGARYLVASAYRGLTRLRRMKKRETYETRITLHDFPAALWKVRCLYPESGEKPVIRSAAELQNTGFQIKMKDVDLRVYKLGARKER